jgi:hypothetical protein
MARNCPGSGTGPPSYTVHSSPPNDQSVQQGASAPQIPRVRARGLFGSARLAGSLRRTPRIVVARRIARPSAGSGSPGVPRPEPGAGVPPTGGLGSYRRQGSLERKNCQILQVLARKSWVGGAPSDADAAGRREVQVADPLSCNGLEGAARGFCRGSRAAKESAEKCPESHWKEGRDRFRQDQGAGPWGLFSSRNLGAQNPNRAAEAPPFAAVCRLPLRYRSR